MKICDGVHGYIWRGYFENNCNMYYFGEPLNILFDPGLKNHIDLRLKSLQEDRIDPAAIGKVVNTHCHPDHFEGSEYFSAKGVPIGMHTAEIDFFNEVGPQFYRMFGLSFPSFQFDLPLKEGIWKINNVELEVFHTPGHSPGSVSVYWPDTRTLVCGDLIFKGSVGRVDFPGGDASKLKASIRRMAELDIEYLLPGHMDYIAGARNVKRNFEMIEEQIFPML